MLPYYVCGSCSIGGPGTREAYQLAYGTGPESLENKQVNPDLFPTERVIGGKDFLGESFVHTAESLASDAEPDDNPIDANRHGTMVADAILSVAPKAQLLACKVCTSDTGTCPGFAVLQALEYALDPNGDGNTDDKVSDARMCCIFSSVYIGNCLGFLLFCSDEIFFTFRWT